MARGVGASLGCIELRAEKDGSFEVVSINEALRERVVTCYFYDVIFPESKAGRRDGAIRQDICYFV